MVNLGSSFEQTWQTMCPWCYIPRFSLKAFLVLKKKIFKCFYHILRMAEGFQKCSQSEGRVEYLPLESNTSNWLNTAYLKMKVDMLFFTIKHCQIFTLMKGHGAGVTVGKCMCMSWKCFIVFLQFDPAFFPPFPLSFPPFSFAFSCALHMLDHLSSACLVLMGLHYEGTNYAKLNIFG